MAESSDTAFQVDLRGLVDLLSHHLYSSPRVYVRELLQNGVDACTARGGGDERPAVLLIGSDVAGDGRMHCFDSGAGLTAEDVGTFLATIGRSSKRDELGFARTDMLGQFGIGLLSAFLVTDEIEVLTRTADAGIVRWLGRDDGSYAVDDPVLAGDDPRAAWLAEGPGTCVSLRPRRGTGEWLSAARVAHLAREYGQFLPHRIEVGTEWPAPVGASTMAIAPRTPPWQLGDPAERRGALDALGVGELGAPPFAVVPVSVPVAGLSGVALVLGRPTASGKRIGSRVYLKGMLLGEGIAGLLPEWAFFCRLVVDTSLLRPTASREALFQDDLLAETREAIGEQVRRWLSRLAASEPERMDEFLLIHQVAAKGMALAEDDLRRLLLPLLRFETTLGVLTLPELLARTDTVHVARTVDEFRQVAEVGAGQGLVIVNGGYVHEYDLLLGAADVFEGARLVPLSLDDLDAQITTIEDARRTEVAWALEEMRAALDRLDVDLELRCFRPASVAALYLDPGTARQRRERRAVAAEADETWAAILDVFDDGGPDRPRLLLNDDNQTVRRLLETTDPALAALGAESVYTRALLMGHHRLRPADLAALDRSFVGLLDRATEGRDG